jgi:hypothetical protein
VDGRIYPATLLDLPQSRAHAADRCRESLALKRSPRASLPRIGSSATKRASLAEAEFLERLRLEQIELELNQRYLR